RPAPLQQALPALDIPPAVEALVLATLSRDPEHRPASARALYQGLVAAEPAPTPLAPAPCESAAPLEVAASAEGLAPAEAPASPAVPAPVPLEPPMEGQYGARFHLCTRSRGAVRVDLGASSAARILQGDGWDLPVWPTWTV